MTVLSVKITATKGQGDNYELKAAAFVTHPEGPKWQLLTRQHLVIASPASVPRAVVLAMLAALSDRGD